ncbi:MAG: 30S ribosomal protein S17 [Patescibacteria group bacterium]|nr:30S ribosomal protein S17 [Patescibacteria group bacterium]MCL5257928.1 30S ribosomal protein S17 [Patescibacteria group bacterium]
MKKRVSGQVVSTKMAKTVVVVNKVLKQEKLYRKFYHRLTRYYADPKDFDLKVGDSVLIEETRPLSKLKRWRVIKILTSLASPEKND